MRDMQDARIGSGALKTSETTAGIGLVVILVSLVLPLINLIEGNLMDAAKWSFAAGALIFVISRGIGAMSRQGTLRMRRLRRMEFWAGAAFVIASAFWFYNLQHLGPYAGVLAILRETIVFSLAGAAIQIAAALLIVRAAKKES